MRTLISYGATLIVLLALDMVWIKFASDIVFRPLAGGILTDQPNLTAAALFYVFFSVGLVFFAVSPAANLPSALLRGALLGFLAYMTFDLTTLAIFKGWPVKVALIDMSWGTFVSAAAAAAGFAAFSRL